MFLGSASARTRGYAMNIKNNMLVSGLFLRGLSVGDPEYISGILP